LADLVRVIQLRSSQHQLITGAQEEQAGIASRDRHGQADERIENLIEAAGGTNDPADPVQQSQSG
jgi:hypothetical protein